MKVCFKFHWRILWRHLVFRFIIQFNLCGVRLNKFRFVLLIINKLWVLIKFKHFDRALNKFIYKCVHNLFCMLSYAENHGNDVVMFARIWIKFANKRKSINNFNGDFQTHEMKWNEKFPLCEIVFVQSWDSNLLIGFFRMFFIFRQFFSILLKQFPYDQRCYFKT